MVKTLKVIAKLLSDPKAYEVPKYASLIVQLEQHIQHTPT